MPITCVKENGLECCYINEAPTNEDCISLSKYFKKYRSAEVRVIYDVGANAHYEMIIGNKTIDLKHDSSLGNFLTSNDGDVSIIMKDAFEDPDKRLKD